MARFRFLSFFALAAVLNSAQFDIAINNGRLIDPASRTDAICSVGINGTKIVSISEHPLAGRQTLDATGLVIAPGFIDLHSHGQTPENYDFKAMDGVTSALELEVGVSPLPEWYAARSGKARVNFGASAGYLPALMSIMSDTGTLLPRDAAVVKAPTDAQWREVLDHVREAIDAGALGVGAGIAYTPLVSRAQIFALFQLAAERRKCLFVHMRNGGPVEPGVVDALQEVIADAAASRAPLHVVHITSMALRQTPLCLTMIEAAARNGLDITTEAYPYTAGMTDLSSAIFDTGWQARLGGIVYSDLQWAATGERLTAESFARFRKTGGMVAIHSIGENEVRLAVADPKVMIASDGLLANGKGHPRAAGTYARVLGRYVREQHALSLPDAIRKITLEPALRLGLHDRGRIAAAAFADIVVFDPQRIQDRATFEQPAQFSTGIRFLLVNGRPVVAQGLLVPNVHPGLGLRASEQ